MPIDQFAPGQFVEVQQDFPQKVWIAEIFEVVGGRLLLSYYGSAEKFWLFWLSERIHPLGWTKSVQAQRYGCYYSQPEGLLNIVFYLICV